LRQNQDLSQDLQQQVAQASADCTPLRIQGGNTKAFYGGVDQATRRLEMAKHSGIIAYEPSELVLTARAGTPLHEIQALLASERQMLGFEPPAFGPQATLGGTMACGFSGPRRPFAGAGRDFMLGCKILNGQAEILTFGGQVMKNVAGFDISRLMVGALGSLGVLLEISLRLLPMPEAELTLCYALSAEAALARMNALACRHWPLSAQAYTDGLLRVRLSGAAPAVQAAAKQLGGDVDNTGAEFWSALREQELAFFQQSGDLWRLSLAPASPPLTLSGPSLLDWNGALRWLKTAESAEVIHAAAAKVDAYAVCFRGQAKTDWFQLPPGLTALQQNIRTAFDPQHIFNPGRLYP